MELISPFINKTNTILAAVAAFLSYMLGDHWALFGIFLFANVIDLISGTYIKARLKNEISSEKGAKGVIKKVGYWLIIMVAFSMSAVFIDVGNTLNIDLSFSLYIGYFTILALIINEFRSILENLVEAGYHPPKILIKGLSVANKVLEKAVDEIDGDEDPPNDE